MERFSFAKKSTIYVLTATILFALFLLVNPFLTEAKTVASPPATGGLQVNVVKSGTAEQVADFSIGDLQGWTQHEEKYSSIDSMPAPVGTLASGVYLSQVLQESGISTADVAGIKLYATDGWYHVYSADYLWGSVRSYYPNLIPGWDSENQIPGRGASNIVVEVQPIFALTSYQERYLDLTSQNAVAAVRTKMDGSGTLCFCFGQKATDIQNGTTTTNNFGKWVYRMDVTLKDRVTPPPTKLSPLPSPILTASYTANGVAAGTVGQTNPVSITFTDDAAWRTAITGITVEGNPLSEGQYTVSASASSGQITINADVFSAEGTYSVVVRATGYTDDYATQIMIAPPALATPVLVLNGRILSWGAVAHAAGYTLTITPDAGTALVQEAAATSFDLTSLSLNPGSYKITVTARAAVGSMQYSDSASSNVVTYTVAEVLPAALVLTADSTDNVVGQSITLTYNSADVSFWEAIKGVAVNGVMINDSLYNKTVPGQLTIDPSLFPAAGSYVISVKADGYQAAVVTQPVLDTTPILVVLNLSGSPSLTYNAEPLYFVLSSGLSLSGKDQYGAAYDLGGQLVTWQVSSGPATVSGNTLIINGTGTVTVSATIGSVTSNPLNLTVGSPAGVPNSGHPDEVILSWTKDPRTTQTVAWRTGTDTTQKQIQYLPADSYSGSFSGAQSMTAVQSDLYTGCYHFEVTLQGLTPATRYVYRVGREGAWSEPSYFTTDGTENPFSFLYMGDVQEGIDAWGTLLKKVYMQNPDLKFGLLGGDMINIANDTSEWEDFLNQASPVSSQIPLMPTAGNHDEPVPGNLGDYPQYWRSFALPENGPEGYKEQFYSFDYGSCHIAVLDSNIMGTTTSASPDYAKISTWLKNDLNGSNQPWKFLVFHHPAYPVVSDAYASTIQKNWTPLFEQCGVDVAFVGHQHVYMRTKSLYNGQVQTDSQRGTVYVMGDAGSKFYPPGLNEEFQYYIDKQIAYKSNYELINIEGNTLTMVAKNDQGQEIDRYSIEKLAPAYTLTPVVDENTYQIGATSDGINTMTVKSGVSGMKYFRVQVTPVKEHRGEEAVVFVHLRNGTQLSINTIKTDFDAVVSAQAVFDVQAGDVVKAYIVDDLTNALDFNPMVLQ